MNLPKSPPKLYGFRLRDLWRLRYRFYALLVIFVLPVILYSGDLSVKDSVSVDAGYRVEESNFLASRIVRETTKNPNIQTQINEAPAISSAKVAIIKEKQKEKPIPNVAWVEDGKIKAFDEKGKELTNEFSASVLYRNFINSLDNNKKNRQNLNELLKQPDQGIKYSWLNFPKYKVQAPIQWANFNDLYETKDGQISFNSIKDSAGLDSPVQKLLEKGIVHLGYTVQPGEIGNSYIAGHSSNFSYVKSDFNTIFKPLESATKEGDEFWIYDQRGRELKFCVFDNLKIAEEDLKTAYKEFPEQRVVTLQTSILGWRNGKIEATHRWLVRGKLCNLDQKQEKKDTNSSESKPKIEPEKPKETQ
jgi:hypothetical protein